MNADSGKQLNVCIAENAWAPIRTGEHFTGVRTIHGCPAFPATSVFHADLSGAPIDEYATQYMIGHAYAITNASWAGGTATVTVANTDGLAVGQNIFVLRVNGTSTSFGRSGYNTGTGCNSSSCVKSDGSYDPRVTITALTGTTVQFALATDPGAYTSGGYISTGPYAGERLSTAPTMAVNTAVSTDAGYQLSCPGCGEGGQDVSFGDFATLNADNVRYVLRNDFKMEGLGNPTIASGPWYPNDAHESTLLTDTCKLQELYGIVAPGPPYYAHTGVEWDLLSNQMRTARVFCPTCTSGIDGPDAAGLPIYPLTLTRNQVYGSEAIDGPVRFTFRTSGAFWRWPAVHKASSNTNVWAAPMGTWFRLKNSFDVSGYSDGTGGKPNTQKVLRALKKYGMVLADNGLSGLITTSQDFSAAEDSALAAELHEVLLDHFEVLNLLPLAAAAGTSYELAPFQPQPQGDHVLVSLASTPPGRTLTIDGASCKTPCQFLWNRGASHTIGAATQTQGGIQYTLSGWSDSGAASHKVAPAKTTTYTATFSTGYAQPDTPAFSPPAGSIAPGVVVTISTTPTSCNPYIYWNTSGNPTTQDTHGTTATVSGGQTLYAKVIGCPSARSDSAIGSAAYSLGFSDTFSGTGALSGKWSNVSDAGVGGGTIVQNSGIAQASAGFKVGTAIVTGQSFTRAQFSQLTITSLTGTGNSISACVLLDTSGNGYCVNSAGNIWRHTGGKAAYIGGGCGAFSAGSVMKIASNAAGLITAYRDGKAVCSVTDTTHSSGSPGFTINNGGTAAATNVQAGAYSAGNN